MKAPAKTPFRLSCLAVGLGGMLAGGVSAQTYTNLHVFTGSPGDGSQPESTLLLSGATLFGTTFRGGTNGSGTVFRVNTDGSNYTNLYSFSVLSYPFAPHTNSDGANPAAGLVLSGNTLFGTAYDGGKAASGAIFRLNTDGSDFTNLYTFTNGNDGSFPLCTLILSGNTLYGTASSGGTPGNGTVFAIHTDGTGFTNLYSFLAGTDGAIPFAGLILSGNTLYGTTTAGGNNGSGVVFAIHTDGSGFTNLYDFTIADPVTGTNADGANPQAPLVLGGNTVYGTTAYGGPAGNGGVFRVDTTGLNFTNLYSFSAFGNYGPNSDGAIPEAGLLLLENTLYGTASYGGTSANGTVFAINTDRSGFTNLHSFANVPNEGALPVAALVLDGGTGNLFGTEFSDDNSEGAVFGLLGAYVPAQLTITISGGNAVLSWPSNSTVYYLEYTTSLAAPGWNVLGGQYSVTDSVAGQPRYYRLTTQPPIQSSVLPKGRNSGR